MGLLSRDMEWKLKLYWNWLLDKQRPKSRLELKLQTTNTVTDCGMSGLSYTALAVNERLLKQPMALGLRLLPQGRVGRNITTVTKLGRIVAALWIDTDMYVWLF